ncbi:uncharacterized protein LOC111682862 [Lucilia cuprina]|uniref:uncharacterized protein LOC111682862 n=1 Tax=Lucilia cuprina TaxID=7375 RepID=UPI001F0642BE|nr:uncharacterized protein LOC111682862 [Lucilia cuprina]
MLFKHLIYYIFFNISLNVGGLTGVEILTPATGLKLLKNVIKLTDTLLEVTPYINITIAGIPPNCVQMACKFVCFNGKSTDIDKDILYTSEKNNYLCSTIDELRLYNYEFPDNILSFGFLGNYSDKVKTLYIASANITDIEAGAFARGKFKEIFFENLHLKELKMDFFEGISSDFNALSIIQRETPLETVYSNFLCYVKYQIKYLTLQAGLKSVRNLTGGDYILNNLLYADFSFNNFSDNMGYSEFSKVSMLEHLDLSHSNLEYLPSYIFSDFTSTLEYLDLSYNKLKTISRSIFGWRELPRDLKIYANDNEWACSCDLQMEFKAIFIYYRTTLLCSEPEWYKDWSVFDDEICGVSSLEHFAPTEPIGETSTSGSINDANMMPTIEINEGPFYKETTEAVSSTSPHYIEKPSFVIKADLVKLDCLTGTTNISQKIAKPMRWPLIIFDVTPQDNLRVDVEVVSPSVLDDSFGLIWFSKVTTQFYKMEINYNEYGLGCFNSISFVTTVDDLVPNTAYTFCIVKKNQVTTSPFSCKSIHVGGNVAVQYSAWLTRDMRITGLSLVIFGIIMFSFAGILMIYLLLKRKPILLKGSKRVTTLHPNSDEIVVLPKENSVQTIKEKEEKLARRGPFSCSQIRRKSNESVASYQSYMNTNLYEVIPAYSKLNNNNNNPSIYITTNATQETTLPDVVDNQDTESCYLTPLQTVSSTANLVKYAEIPYRAKRMSNDALPDVPADQPPLSLALSESLDKPEYAQVGTIYTLDSQV